MKMVVSREQFESEVFRLTSGAHRFNFSKADAKEAADFMIKE